MTEFEQALLAKVDAIEAAMTRIADLIELAIAQGSGLVEVSGSQLVVDRTLDD